MANMESSCHLSEITNKKWQSGNCGGNSEIRMVELIGAIFATLPPLFKNLKKIKI